MSTIDFDKFDLDGLSLESMQEVKSEEPKSENISEPSTIVNAHEKKQNSADIEADSRLEREPIPEPEQSVEIVIEDSQADNSEEQMTCPKCELQQIKAEQCSGCGVYVEKALAQIGQSNIQITAVKF